MLHSSRKLYAGAVMGIVTTVAGLGARRGPLDHDVKQLVKVEAVASSGTAVAGKPVTLAVKFTIEPHWHIYWHNPGDSGMATAFTVKAPAGWTVSPPRFPLPKKFEQAGGLVGYGYENEAVFLVDVTPPADFTGEARLTVNAVFLVCEEVCLPGNESRSVTLTAGAAAEATPGWIADAERQMPLTFDGDVKTTGVISTGWSPFSVSLGGTSKEWTGVEVFPMALDEIELRNLQSSVGSNGAGSATIRFEAKQYEQAALLPANMTLLAVFTTKSGERVGRWIEVPTGAPPAGTTRPAATMPAK